MTSTEAPLRVVVAGGGVAAVEALLGLHALADRAPARRAHVRRPRLDPRPFHPVRRGQLLIGRAQRFLETPIHGGEGAGEGVPVLAATGRGG